MKNNEMVSSGIVSFKLPEKFTEDHPVAATVIYLVPVAVPVIWKGAKYIVDKIAETKIECYRIKVAAENNIVASTVIDDSETVSSNDSIVA